ncbi:glutathione S-transferase [Rhodothalassium salexigens DSM 2132]|uniref:Glutathione S-transferase n=1 Tax=Rhodothalassium salexigens DSM 2132 TaxID=1188247 RepID=A0A4R2P8V9_RHOSA|nr:glutathione S-transferase family protein [Rhodothalassium salexigens]MBB4212634.1 glutathione S-transferase [Rhodothalassium salexigens DSM 2132]MBK1638752.1 hypothetical protein [Rhodothalassium salexigens DSM 2132]TCP30768.1 glutathione S-transferase [Rhodothalassium salexigens DSM 2132]
MLVLFHNIISPSARAVRLFLAEKGVEADLREEPDWEGRIEFRRLSPEGEVPLLLVDGGHTIAGFLPICEYLEELHPEPPMLGRDLLARAEVRRLALWYGHRFWEEVGRYLITEKIIKRLYRRETPDTEAIRAGLQNLRTHLDYLDYLATRRHYLTGTYFTLADAIAAAQVSVLDYLGHVAWDDHPGAREWYMLVKSRKSMRHLLGERIAGIRPPKYYDQPDF